MSAVSSDSTRPGASLKGAFGSEESVHEEEVLRDRTGGAAMRLAYGGDVRWMRGEDRKRPGNGNWRWALVLDGKRILGLRDRVQY